ncbi:hypothetical protein JCM10212_002845 [Sporobolomyces blumeae]
MPLSDNVTDASRSGRILVVHSPLSLLHDPPHEILSGCVQPYFESPARYHTILDALNTDKERYGERKLDWEPGQVETDELTRAIEAVHERDYVAFLRGIYREWIAEGGSKDAVLPESFLRRDLLLEPPSLPDNVDESAIAKTGRFSFDLSAPITRDTFAASLASCRVALEATDLVRKASQDGDAGVFALCRPPGHHATPALCGGYCFLNNVACAARHYQLGSPNLERAQVAILDIDYHHGNGTSKVFYDDPSVLYVSLHGTPDYPYYTGASSERGGPSARNLNLNYPLPLGTDDTTYLSTLREATSKISDFKPEILFVSLGVDTFADDPLTEFNITLEAYPEMGKIIGSLRMRTVFVMEGGYCLPAIGQCVKGVLDGFLSTRNDDA